MCITENSNNIALEVFDVDLIKDNNVETYEDEEYVTGLNYRNYVAPIIGE